MSSENKSPANEALAGPAKIITLSAEDWRKSIKDMVVNLSLPREENEPSCGQTMNQQHREDFERLIHRAVKGSEAGARI